MSRGRPKKDLEKDAFGCDHQQWLMVRYYLEDPQRRKALAYQRVYRPDEDTTNGFSPSCRSTAMAAFANPAVIKAVDACLAEINERFALERASVVRSFAETAFFNLAEMFDDDGNPIPIHKLPPHVNSAVQGFDIETVYDDEGRPRASTYKVKLVSKHDSRLALARILNLFEADNKGAAESVAAVLSSLVNSASGGSRGLPSIDEKRVDGTVIDDRAG